MEILWSTLQRGIIFDELYNQGFTNCGILPSRMGGYGVSRENMETGPNKLRGRLATQIFRFFRTFFQQKIGYFKALRFWPALAHSCSLRRSSLRRSCFAPVYPASNEEHGKNGEPGRDGKYQQDDLKHSIYTSKLSICD